MTVNVFVSNLAEAGKINHHFDSVISVLSPGYLNFAHGDHLYVPMDDTADPRWGDAPTVDNIKTIVDWATPRVFDDNKILVHCYAGMSRSTATALGLCVLGGMDEDDAWAHVYEERPDLNRDFIPNPLILSHFDKVLGSHLLEGSDRKYELNRKLGWATR